MAGKVALGLDQRWGQEPSADPGTPGGTLNAAPWDEPLVPRPGLSFSR